MTSQYPVTKWHELIGEPTFFGKVIWPFLDSFEKPLAVVIVPAFRGDDLVVEVAGELPAVNEWDQKLHPHNHTLSA